MRYSYQNLKAAAETPRGKKFIAEAKVLYDSLYKDSPVTVIRYSLYKLIAVNGDRSIYEKEYFSLRNRLKLLQLLCLSDEAYLEDLQNTLSAICEQYSWVLPAHSLKNGVFDYTVVDLFSAETALYLSETAYIFKDRLYPDVICRIKERVDNYVLKNFENNRYFWENCGTNWAAVCGGCVGMTYMYLYPERFEKVKDRILSVVDDYLNAIDDEGVCGEGMGYWVYGFSFFCNFYDNYTIFTSERRAVIDCEKISATLEYFRNSRLDGDKYLPYADGGAEFFRPCPARCFAIKNLYGDKFVLPELDLDEYFTLTGGGESKRGGKVRDVTTCASCEERPSARGLTGRADAFHVLYGISRYGVGREDSRNFQRFYKNAGIFIKKTDKYAFTAKCGHNCELHNHNDVGGFEIVRNNERLVSDLGGGRYTYQYFNVLTSDYDGRYGEKIFTCGSISHSVPIINGKPQKNGEKYVGKVLSYGADFFEMEISGAYEVKIDGVTVRFTASENGVTARYDCSGFKDIVFRFVSDIEPERKKDGLYIRDMKVVCDKDWMPEIKAHGYLNHSGLQKTAYTLDYAYAESDRVTVEFSFIFR